MYKARISGEEIEHWPYWELEHYIEKYKEWLEKEKAAQESSGSGKSAEQLTQGKIMQDVKTMQKDMGLNSIPKMPNISDFKVPDFSKNFKF